MYLLREVEGVLRKTRVWNSGLISGLERTQAQLEDDLEVQTETIDFLIINRKSRIFFSNVRL